MNIEPHLTFIIKAHQDHPNVPINAFRLWDKRTPYSIHPIWCAMTISTETSIPKKIREDGFLALLYHDVLEDTKKKLPRTLDDRVRHLINDMTFHGGIQEEMEKIWSKSQEVRLLKLYDKISNLLDGTWMTQEKRRVYLRYTERLIKNVEQKYGKLNITHIARAVCKMI